MRSGLYFAVSLLLSVCTLDVHAQAQGRVTAGYLSYTLIDLDPLDGIDPSISFASNPVAATDSAWGTITEWRGENASYVQEFGSGTKPFSISLQKPYASAIGHAAGEAHDAPFALELSAFANGSDGSDAKILADLASFRQEFVLSPNTGLLTASVVNITGGVTRAGEMFQGLGQIIVSGPQADGTRAAWVSGELATASFEPGDAPQVDRQFNVEVAYWNDQAVAVSGTVSFSLFAFAVSPVPEPERLPLAVAGAGLLLGYFRKRGVITTAERGQV